MESFLDLNTLLVGQVLLSFIWTLLLFAFIKLAPYIKGVKPVTVAYLIGTLARICYIFNSTVAADLGAVLATLLFYVGLLQHFEKTPPRKFLVIICSLIGVIFLFRMPWGLSTSERLFGVYSLVAILRFLCALVLFRSAKREMLPRAFGVFMVVYCVAECGQYVLGQWKPAALTLHALTPDEFELVFVLTNVVCSIILGICFLLLFGNAIVLRAEYQAFLDPLTGRLNRRGIEERLYQELALAERGGGHTFSVALIDLDYFKSINDTYGHGIGDAALRCAMQTIVAMIRSYDWAGRLGGDEFTLVLPSTGALSALATAERICRAVADAPFDVPIRLSVSIGVAQYETHDTQESLLKRADIALYQAKGDGRGCARYYAKKPVLTAELFRQSLRG